MDVEATETSTDLSNTKRHCYMDPDQSFTTLTFFREGIALDMNGTFYHIETVSGQIYYVRV